MYEAFYGLKERPFNLTPDPRYLYLSEKHKEAFAHLLYGIKHRAGFVMVTGEIGTGKTTICRTLLNQLDADTEVAFIFNPSLSPVELLKKINEDFGIESRAKTVKDLIDELNEYLLDSNARGKNCVLVIDEAQNLTPSVLEQIRLLSNLESETQKLLQIVLIGQPELGEHLELRELRQLKQRITARYHLKALDNKETQQYVTYRLRVAGAHRRIQFTPSALRTIYAHSKGTPRVINSLCDRALLIGYTQEASEITKEIAQRAAKELKGEPVKKRRDFSVLKTMIPNPTVIALAILAMIAGKYYLENRAAFTPLPAPTTGVAERSTDVADSGAESFASSPAVAEAATATISTTTPLPALPYVEEPLEFGDVLDGIDGAEARDEAARAVLSRWDIESPSALPESDDLESLVAFAEANGFVAETLSPSLAQLTAINLPALVRVSHADRQLWLAVVSSGDDMLNVTTADGVAMDVPVFQFMERYLAEAVILWRDEQPDAPVLLQEMSGDPVRFLQIQLKRLGLLESLPTGYFGARTAKAVSDLQRETGLTPDGIAGRMTRMVLASWLPGFDTPALDSESKHMIASLDQSGQPAAPPKVVSVLAPDTGDASESLAALGTETLDVDTVEVSEPDAPEPIEAATRIPDPGTPPVEIPVADPIASATVIELQKVAPENDSDASPEPAELLGSGGPEIPVESFHEWFESVGSPVPLTPQTISERDLPAPHLNADDTTPPKKAVPPTKDDNSANGNTEDDDFEAASIMPLVPHEPAIDKDKPADAKPDTNKSAEIR
jgi:general secretion pathway protein A